MRASRSGCCSWSASTIPVPASVVERTQRGERLLHLHDFDPIQSPQPSPPGAGAPRIRRAHRIRRDRPVASTSKWKLPPLCPSPTFTPATGACTSTASSSSDETVVRLAQAREDAGEDPARFVEDALEIGARVLDREQTGANAEFVKTEFERAARELDAGLRRTGAARRRAPRRQVRRGVRPRERPPHPRAGQALLRRQRDGRAASRQGGARRGDDPLARGPHPPVLLRRREQPARRLQADVPGDDAPGRRAPGDRSCAR